jgi:hypothetical protein
VTRIGQIGGDFSRFSASLLGVHEDSQNKSVLDLSDFAGLELGRGRCWGEYGASLVSVYKFSSGSLSLDASVGESSGWRLLYFNQSQRQLYRTSKKLC